MQEWSSKYHEKGLHNFAFEHVSSELSPYDTWMQGTNLHIVDLFIFQKLCKVLRKVNVSKLALHVDWPHLVVLLVVYIIEIHFSALVSQ